MPVGPKRSMKISKDRFVFERHTPNLHRTSESGIFWQMIEPRVDIWYWPGARSVTQVLWSEFLVPRIGKAQVVLDEIKVVGTVLKDSVCIIRGD